MCCSRAACPTRRACPPLSWRQRSSRVRPAPRSVRSSVFHVFVSAMRKTEARADAAGVRGATICAVYGPCRLAFAASGSPVHRWPSQPRLRARCASDCAGDFNFESRAWEEVSDAGKELVQRLMAVSGARTAPCLPLRQHTLSVTRPCTQSAASPWQLACQSRVAHGNHGTVAARMAHRLPPVSCPCAALCALPLPAAAVPDRPGPARDHRPRALPRVVLRGAAQQPRRRAARWLPLLRGGLAAQKVRPRACLHARG
jgi:hypothetical protein